MGFAEGFKASGFTENVLATIKAKQEKNTEEAKKKLKIVAQDKAITNLRQRIQQSGQNIEGFDLFAEGLSDVKDPDVRAKLVNAAIAQAGDIKTPEEKTLERLSIAQKAKGIDRSVFEKFGGQPAQVPQGTGGVTQPTAPTTGDSEIQAPEIDQFTGKMTSKGLQQETRNKEIQARRLAAQKPLSGEAARFVSGAKQGKAAIQDIKKIFNFKTDAKGNVTADNFKDLKDKFLSEQLLQKMGVGRPGSLAQVVSFGSADFWAKLFKATSSEGRELSLLFATIAENTLRQRTGAAAPEPEQIREEVRSFMNALDEPKSALAKLEQNELFLSETIAQVKPSAAKQATSGKLSSGIPFEVL